jgi:hypothetical protein
MSQFNVLEILKKSNDKYLSSEDICNIYCKKIDRISVTSINMNLHRMAKKLDVSYKRIDGRNRRVYKLKKVFV